MEISGISIILTGFLLIRMHGKNPSGTAGAFLIFLVNNGACFTGSEHPSTLFIQSQFMTVLFQKCILKSRCKFVLLERKMESR